MTHGHQPSRSRAYVATATALAALTLGGTALTQTTASAAGGGTRGHDVSSYQRAVDWQQARNKGARFVYVKATESTNYRNPFFGAQYNGARNAGIIRGAYHFAVPNKSSGQAQAAYFVKNGGGWRADGWTLPPAVDLEYNPYGKQKCYGLSQGRMVSWVRAFSDEVRRRTGRRPVIYTSYHWWKVCTGDSRALAGNHALWLARYDDRAGMLPAGWAYWTFWQYGNSGGLPGDQNLFNGSQAQLRSFARG
ncbi:lysozyme [Streptomyces sp. NPDC046821]|uniref:lysozyme n=1 Tax=Streptomyces sp. NPDC046821 TaxID=3154702 RepID=UPI0033CE9999